MQAIKAGAKVNTEALGKINDMGTIEVGKFATKVAVKGDPIKDINKRKVVMKGGRVVKLEN